MPDSGIKSLFNSVNFFHRKPQTWAVTNPSETIGVSPAGCQFEALESRVLMSVAHSNGHEEFVARHAAPSLSAKKLKAAALVAPTAPTSLTATPLTFNSVQLNWTAGTGTTTGYIVLRGTDGIHFAQIARLTGSNISTYTDKTAASFHNYDYELEGLNGTVASAASAPAAASTALATPATFSAAATGPNAIKLTWAINEPLATGYNILRATDGVHFSQLVQIPSIKIATYTDTAVSSNTTYSYEIQAYNGNKTSLASKAVAVITPLTAPIALSAALQNSAMSVTWTGNDSTAAGYLVYRSVNGAAFTQVANVTGNSTTSFSDTGVISGRVYTYKVEAYAGSNTSAFTVGAPVSTPLNAPTALSATVTSPTVVHLAWTNNDANAAGYNIMRSADGVHYTRITQVTGVSVATYNDATAISGTSYFYQVTAFATTIVSDPTTAATVTLPLATPATLTCTVLTPTSIKLTWTISDPLTTGYNLLRSTNGGSFEQITQLIGKSANTFTDAVSSNTAYSYEVQATNSTNASAISKAASVTTPVSAPTALSATLDGSAIDLSWTGNDTSAAGYLVLRSVNGGAFAQVANVTDNSTTTYSDSAIISGRTYTYEVKAYAGSNSSAFTPTAAASTPLSAPSALSATTTSPTAVHLAWTNNDANPFGYYIMRSTDGVHFTKIAQVLGAATASYNDATAVSGTSYSYQVTAFAGTITSAPTDAATATMPLATPATLTCTVLSPTSIKLIWSISDQLATGYNVLRSTNGGNFEQITQLSGKTANTFTDTVSSDTSYSYEVQAINNGNASAISRPIAVSTPLIPVSGLSASLNGTNVELDWTDNDSSAAGYKVLRASDGVHFTQIANIADPAAATYTDTTSLSGHAYAYEVQAYGSGSMASAFVATASLTVPLSAPTSLGATALSPTSVALTWTNTDANATSYIILRSTDGTHFTQITKLTGVSVAAYTDTAAASGQNYTYAIEATNGTFTSPASNTANLTTSMAAPMNLSASMAGAYVNLTWTDKATLATGYTILRSSDNITFTQLIQLNSATASSYSDTTVVAGQTYYYQVQASNTLVTSIASNTAAITTPSGNVTSGVSVVIRFGDELVITAAGSSDSVSITESGGVLTITGDGQTFTDDAPAAGTFVYTRGGSDSINIDASVNSQITIDSIDAAPTVITSNGTSVNAWIDSTDTLVGTATTHAVASFAAGVSKALGAALANPKDAGATARDNLSLFGAGPIAADINQGEVGDCYFLSSLAAFANQNPQVLLNSAVDLGDGTYAVEFQRNGGPVYVRVNNSFTTGGFGGYDYAHPGPNNTIWAAVMEKAFCYFRTGANTYASINSGWMGEVYSDLGIASANFTPSSLSDNALFNLLQTDLSNGEAVTFGTQNAPNLVSGHAYTLLSVVNVGGVNRYVVRNPWGVSGDSLENSQGIATLTYAQLIANFVAGCAATN